LVGQNCGQSTPFLGFVIEPAAQIVAFAFYLFKLIPHPGKLGLDGCSPGFPRCFRSFDLGVGLTVGANTRNSSAASIRYSTPSRPMVERRPLLIAFDRVDLLRPTIFAACPRLKMVCSPPCCMDTLAH
jgi:hypothetical protein